MMRRSKATTSDQVGAQPARRLSANKMIIIGLTGSIAMGKTTVARQFADCGAAICDSDLLVHDLLGEYGEAVEQVGRLFPTARKGNHIDRKALGKEVFGSAEKLKALEAILHPLVRKEQDKFLRRAKRHGKAVAVLDIPLLFETGGEKRCNYTVVASAPYFLQRMRVLDRFHMSEEKFRQILARQMKNSEKIKRADFVVFTGIGKYNSLKQVKQILLRIRKGQEYGADKHTGEGNRRRTRRSG